MRGAAWEEIGDRPRFRTFRSERNPPVDARGILSAGCGTRFARTVLACARNSPRIPGYGGDDGPVVGELQRALPASHSQAKTAKFSCDAGSAFSGSAFPVEMR